MNRLSLLCLVWVFLLVGRMPGHGQNPSLPKGVNFLTKTPADRGHALRTARWIDVIEREVPPLKNPRGDQMPMIMWHGVGFQPLTAEQLKVMSDRGLCQHLQLSTSAIPAAKVLQAANHPVILMEGRTDHWPYSLAKDATSWPHEFDDLFLQKWYAEEDESKWHGACPHRTAGWRVLSENTKNTLEKFREARVTVDAVWVDYEGDPYPWSHLFEQLQHCKRCRRELPEEVVRDKSAWRNYCWQQYVRLYDQHFAKAVREVFPECSVTNWHVVFSGQVEPVRYFVRDVQLPKLKPEFFSATNPIAYGSDLAWRELSKADDAKTQDAVDDFYAFQMTQQVTADRRNRIACGMTKVHAVPWIARVCLIAAGDESLPVMTRTRYRKTLEEVWENGVRTMQIFNPMREGYEELSLMEIQDAVAAFDAMLEQRTASN